MSNYAADVPLINVPFVRPDGRVSEAWFMFLIQLFRRTGGTNGNSLDDLAVDVATMSDDPAISSLSDALENTNVQIQADPNDAPDKAQKADLAAQSVALALILQEAQDVLTKLRRALQDAVIDQLTALDPIRSMAYQDASGVNIKGGSINGTPIGATAASTGAFTSLSVTSGNLTFAGTAQRIQADFSNGTISNRLDFQTSTPNSFTSVGIIPNGTNQISQMNWHNSSSPDISSYLAIGITSAKSFVNSRAIGGASALPLAFQIASADMMTLNTNGNLLIGTTTDGLTSGGSLAVAQDFGHRGTKVGFYNTTPVTKPTVTGSRGGNAALASLLTALASEGLITDSTTA
jgi:hypothetical protein